MEKMLCRQTNKAFHFVNGKMIEGHHSNIRGDVSNIRGDVSDIRGDVSNIQGNIDDCKLTSEDRRKGVDIQDLVKS